MKLAVAVGVGLALGFGAGWLASEQPWDSGPKGTVTLTEAREAVAQLHGLRPADVRCQPAIAQADTTICGWVSGDYGSILHSTIVSAEGGDIVTIREQSRKQ